MHCQGSIIPVPLPCYEIRLGGPGWRHGEPYTRGVLVVDHGFGLAEMRLVVTPIQPSEMREILRLLRGAGFSRLLIERRRNGKVTRRVKDIRARARRNG